MNIFLKKNEAGDMELFNNIIAELLRDMGVSEKGFSDAGNIYTFTINGDVEIKLVGVQEGELNFISRVGNLSGKIRQEVFLTLLTWNQFTFDQTPITVGMDPESRDVVLWARQKLSDLDAPTAIKLFKNFADSASALQGWINTTLANDNFPSVAGVNHYRNNLDSNFLIS
jgi:hypothetical protein